MIYINSTIIAEAISKARTRLSGIAIEIQVRELQGDFAAVANLELKSSLIRALINALTDPNIFDILTDEEIESLYQRLHTLAELSSIDMIYNYNACLGDGYDVESNVVTLPLDHTNLEHIINTGRYTHIQIDAHLENYNNPHLTTIVNLNDTIVTNQQNDDILIYNNGNWINVPIDSVIGPSQVRNGLNVYEDYIELGGTLIRNTVITAPNDYDFDIFSSVQNTTSDGFLNFAFLPNSTLGSIVLANKLYNSQINQVGVWLEAKKSDLSDSKRFIMSSDFTKYYNMDDDAGIEYAEHFWDNYTEYSLVDKEYVDTHLFSDTGTINVIARDTPLLDGWVLYWNYTEGKWDLKDPDGFGSDNSFNNALTKTDDLVQWGGALIKNTTVDGNLVYNTTFDRISLFKVNAQNYNLTTGNTNITGSQFDIVAERVIPTAIPSKLFIGGQLVNSVQQPFVSIESGANNSDNIKLRAFAKRLEVQDDRVTKTGLQYASIYPDTNWTNTTLPHKYYVDNHLFAKGGTNIAKNPTVTQDGYVLFWNNTNNAWDLKEPEEGGSSYTFENGLIESGGTVKQGGWLTEDTTILGSAAGDANVRNFGYTRLKQFKTHTSALNQELSKYTSIYHDNEELVLSIFNGLENITSADIRIFKDSDNFNKIRIATAGAGGGQGNNMVLYESEFVISGPALTYEGVKYGAKYHSNYTLRSLVDKEYVDLAVGSGGYTHPNHTGDVTSVGDGATTIANGVVTNAKLADMPSNTVKSRILGTNGEPQNLPLYNNQLLGRLTGNIQAIDITTDTNLTSNSNAEIPTEKAVKGYADTHLKGYTFADNPSDGEVPSWDAGTSTWTFITPSTGGLSAVDNGLTVDGTGKIDLGGNLTSDTVLISNGTNRLVRFGDSATAGQRLNTFAVHTQNNIGFNTYAASSEIYFRTVNHVELGPKAIVTSTNGKDPQATYTFHVDGDSYVEGTLYATSDIVAGSDIRLKDNIQDLAYSIEDLLKLRPVSYTEKSTGKSKIGLIAQEVKEVIPEVVNSPETEEGYYGIDYAKLVPLLINVIKDQDQRIKQLEDKIK